VLMLESNCSGSVFNIPKDSIIQSKQYLLAKVISPIFTSLKYNAQANALQDSSTASSLGSMKAHP
jgi:hypothetical protein